MWSDSYDVFYMLSFSQGIQSWIIVTGDLLTEHVLKCLIYGDKGRDGTIVLRLLSVTFFKHWRPLSHFPRTRPFPQLDTAVV